MSRLSDVASGPFDVVVIGGGINGAGIAQEAAQHGYRTLLVERNDFASGTTSRATRLIHGGLRYLEHGELGLVYESLGERETLVREAPHLVRPLRLLVPVYAGDARPAWKVRAGLALYDALSFRKSLPAHGAVSRRRLAELEPRLSTERLSALYAFSDAQVEFPERLVIESVRTMTEAGGVALNHVEATGLRSPGGIVRGVLLRDALTGETAEVSTKVVVNAAGPWVDQVLAGSDAERHEPLIGGTKGSHLVVRWPDGPRQAVFAMAKADGRPFFVLPWYRYTLVGTTDLRYDGDPSAARATVDEVRYLVDEANRLFPSVPLRREDILYTYSGVRPLPYAPGEREAAITRRHLIIDHVKRGGPTGLLTVVGGKLTTYRSLARLAMPAVAKHVEPAHARAETDRAGEHDAHSGSILSTDNPLALYGRRGGDVLAHVETGDSERRHPICEHNPEVLGQVTYALQHEQAMTLADVLLRRLPSGWSECHALDGAERAAGVMARHFGWDAARTAEEVQSYERELRETLVPLDAIGDGVSGGEGAPLSGARR